MEGVGVLAKEELCEKVVEVRRKSDRVMTLKEEVVRIVCMVRKVAEQVERKSVFMMIWESSEWDLQAWVS